MTITGDRVVYDLAGSHPCIGTLYNSAFGGTFSAVVAGMKTFFPDLPLNSGFYRPIEVIAPEDTVVNARWPVAVTGFLVPFEKIMGATYEIWSKIMPERAIACVFNNEYLLTGGRDLRGADKSIFMFYDWMPGGWGGRNGRDGTSVTTSSFGCGMMSQPVEGQERTCPMLTTDFEILTDSAGPGPVARRAPARGKAPCCGRPRAPSSPTSATASVPWFGASQAVCPRSRTASPSPVPVPNPNGSALSSPMSASTPATISAAPTAGGGGFGDPLLRDPLLVREDVADGYVSVARAARDYGVVILIVDEELAEYAVDEGRHLGRARQDSRGAERLAGGRCGDCGRTVSRGGAGYVGSRAPLRGFAQLADWCSASQDDGATSRDDAEAIGGFLVKVFWFFFSKKNSASFTSYWRL